MTFFEQLFEKLGGTYFEISSNLWKALSISMAHVSIEMSTDLGYLAQEKLLWPESWRESLNK